jgi:hypothetical protein
MPFQEKVPNNAIKFWSEEAQKVLGSSSELAINVVNNEQYSREIILQCNANLCAEEN